MQGDFHLALMVYCVFTHTHLPDFNAYHWTSRDSESGHPLSVPVVRTAYSVCTIWYKHIPLILWLLKTVMGQTLLDPRFELCLATFCFCQHPSIRTLGICKTVYPDPCRHHCFENKYKNHFLEYLSFKEMT